MSDEIKPPLDAIRMLHYQVELILGIPHGNIKTVCLNSDYSIDVNTIDGANYHLGKTLVLDFEKRYKQLVIKGLERRMEEIRNCKPEDRA